MKIPKRWVVNLGVFAILTTVASFGHSKSEETFFKESQVLPTDKIKISLFRGDVSYTATSPGTPLEVKIIKSSDSGSPFEGWKLAQRKEGNTYVFEAMSPDQKSEALASLQGAAPKLNLEIKAPPTAVDISVKEGNIKGLFAKQNVTLTHQSGVIEVLSGSGELKINSYEGQVKIENYEGALLFDGFSPKLLMKKFKGPSLIRNFSGNTLVTEYSGALTLKLFQSSASLSKGSGKIDFEAFRGGISVGDWEGDLSGESDMANISVRIKDLNSVRVKSNGGNVTIYHPATSGAKINLGSEEGKIYAPEGFKIGAVDKLKIAQGKLGGTGGGQVFIRTKTGDIKAIKQ